jgi:hypothetical protein
MKIKKPMGATIALVIGLGGLGFASPAFADEAVAPEVVTVEVLEETEPAKVVTEEVVAEEVAAAKTKPAEPATPAVPGESPATPATPAVPDKGPKDPKPEVDPTPYLTIAWQMTGYVDAVTGVFPDQKILGFVETATPDLNAADGFLANAKCGTGVQFDVNYDNPVSRALIAGGFLNGPNNPQEALIPGGWGVAYKVLPTAACVVVPEKPPVIVDVVSNETLDCETDVWTKTTVTTTTDFELVLNVWTPLTPVSVTTTETRAAEAEDCPVTVVPPVTPETPVTPPTVNPPAAPPVVPVSSELPDLPDTKTVASNERLASTGVDLTAPVGIAGLLLVLGTAALIASRRKAGQN